jgi:hypothetical protein
MVSSRLRGCFLCLALDYRALRSYMLLRTIKDVLKAAENDLIDLLGHAQLSGFLTLYIQRV